jgi:hypothetical protein
VLLDREGLKAVPKSKPIRVFFSELSRRFYATRAYRIDDRGIVTVTGKKFDVTNDIAGLIEQHEVEFKIRSDLNICPACQNPNECYDAGECILSRPEYSDLP